MPQASGRPLGPYPRRPPPARRPCTPRHGRLLQARRHYRVVDRHRDRRQRRRFAQSPYLARSHHLVGNQDIPQAAATIASASPTLAQVMPCAPAAICLVAIVTHLCVLTCGGDQPIRWQRRQPWPRCCYPAPRHRSAAPVYRSPASMLAVRTISPSLFLSPMDARRCSDCARSIVTHGDAAIASNAGNRYSQHQAGHTWAGRSRMGKQITIVGGGSSTFVPYLLRLFIESASCVGARSP